MRRRTWMWIAHHSVLIAGVVIFALPFAWLVLTSVKQDDELFRKQTFPELPVGVERSPYAAPTSGSVPGGVFDAVLERACTLDQPRCQVLARDISLERAFVHGLYEAAARRVEADSTTEVLTQRITVRDVARVFDDVYRAVRLRESYVWDREYREYRLAGSLEAWTVVSGDARLTPANFSRGEARRLEYGLAEPVVLRLDMSLPFDASEFHRLALPLRGDRTWYAMSVRLWIDGQAYRSTRAFFLRSDRWMDLAWQRPSREDLEPGFKEYITLEPAPDLAPGPSGILRVELEFRDAGRTRLAGRKLFANYSDTFDRIPFWKYVFNSVLIVVLNVLGALIVCPLVAYAFARWDWPGRDVWFVLLLATMMLPAQVTMVPVFLIYKTLGWHDTLKPLFVGSFFGNAFFIFLLRQFMRSIPRDLERAARIDGCGFFGVFRHVILPLIKPSLAAIAVFQFMASWNNFLGPLIYLNSQELYPLALGLFEFKEKYGVDYGMLMAASLLMTLPVIVVFFVAQRYFIQGVTLTGLKG